MKPTESPLYQLIWSTRPLLQVIERAVSSGLPPEVTVRMRAVMEVLADGPATVPEVARALSINRQYVQLMVNEALSAELALTEPNPAHARSSLIRLSGKGAQLIAAIRERETRLMNETFADLSPDEVETALSVSRRLLHGFQAMALANDERGNDDD